MASLYLNIDSDVLQSIKKHETIINEATKGQLEAKIRYTVYCIFKAAIKLKISFWKNELITKDATKGHLEAKKRYVIFQYNKIMHVYRIASKWPLVASLVMSSFFSEWDFQFYGCLENSVILRWWWK